MPPKDEKRFGHAEGAPTQKMIKPPTLPGCYAIADGLLVSSSASYPPDLTPDVLIQLAQAGVRSVVALLSREQFLTAGPDALLGPVAEDGDDLTDEHQHPVQQDYCFWPLNSRALPSAKCLHNTLDAMDARLHTDRHVLVHGAGSPRRAVIAAGCWLARHGFGDPATSKGLLARLYRATGGDVSRVLSLSDDQRGLIYRWPPGR